MYKAYLFISGRKFFIPGLLGFVGAWGFAGVGGVIRRTGFLTMGSNVQDLPFVALFHHLHWLLLPHSSVVSAKGRCQKGINPFGL